MSGDVDAPSTGTSSNSLMPSTKAIVDDGGAYVKNSSGSINSTSVTKYSSSFSPNRRY